MTKVNTPYFLASRLRTGRGSVMARIATGSVALGLAVMILALGVIFGFKREITARLTGMMAHVRITDVRQTGTFESTPISSDQPFVGMIEEMPGVANLARYAQTPGILRGEEAFQGILLKGVGPEYDGSFFEDALIEGNLPAVADSARVKEILLSRRLAEAMGLAVGDPVELMFLREPPRRDRYRVAGIYATDMPEIDNLLLLTDIRNLQRLNRQAPDQITGFEIRLDRFDDLESFSTELFDRLVALNDPSLGNLMITNLKESSPLIFDWLATHDLNGWIVIGVMLAVAVFNLIAALLILVLEKTQWIGILKALGMADGPIRRVFLYRVARIAGWGMLWGNAVGIGLCLLQKHTGWVKLDADGYFLAEVPIHLDWGMVALLNAGVFAVILVALLIPTRIVTRISPRDALSFS